jgi:hypothetical protein
MFTIDFINALFEFSASFAIIINIIKLIKDKQIKGISLWSSTFFMVWGIWNIYYYNELQQSFSFYCCIIMCILNIGWLSLAAFFKFKNKIK